MRRRTRRGRVAAEGTPADVLRAPLLSEVYRYPVDVLPHPVTGELLVLADRSAARTAPLEETP